MFKQTEHQQKKNYKASIYNGIFYTLMNSIAVAFLVPFIILLGAKPIQVGLLDTLPFFLTSFLTLISYRLLPKLKSKKQFVIFFVLLMAFLWIPLALAHFIFSRNVTIWIIILIYTFIIGCQVIHIPVNTDWIRKLFPQKTIGEYTASIQIIYDIVSVVILLVTGYLLDVVNHAETLIGFTVIFLLAGVFRYISATYLYRMSTTETKDELTDECNKMARPAISVFKKEVLKDKQFLYFLIFVVFFYFGVYIASSYINYFYLAILKMDYSNYIGIQIATVIGAIFSLSYWGYICDKFGVIKILKTTILFAPFIPLLVMLLAPSMILLLLLNFFSGMIWAGINLSISDYFYKNINKDLINHVSYYTIIQSFAAFLGVLVGAGILSLSKSLFNSEVMALAVVFALSAIMRFIAVLFGRRLKDHSKRKTHLFRDILLQRPIIFGLKRFQMLASEEEKKLLHTIISKEQKLKVDMKDAFGR